MDPYGGALVNIHDGVFPHSFAYHGILIINTKAQYDSKSNMTYYNYQNLNQKLPNFKDNLDPKLSLSVESDMSFSHIIIMVMSCLCHQP
jgi:hypothetical protein